MLDAFPELKEQKYAGLLDTIFVTWVIPRELESVAYIGGDDGLKKFNIDYCEYIPLLKPNGDVSVIMITVNDVTVKVEARIKLEENEKNLGY